MAIIQEVKKELVTDLTLILETLESRNMIEL
jgi:hypothetical protein